MTARRWFTIGLTLAAVAVGGWKNAIPGLDFASSSRDGTNPVAIASAFSQAGPALAAYYSTAGTYSGAELAPTSPVQLVWTTEVSYCLQGGDGAGALHMIGPTGLPQSGPCPAGV